MFRIGVEFNDIDLNVFPDAKVIGVDNCLEWCIAGESIETVEATEGKGAGGGGGNNRAPDENAEDEVCKSDLDSAVSWDNVLLCKIAAAVDEDGVPPPARDIW